jgi:hypothetical protein
MKTIIDKTDDGFKRQNWTIRDAKLQVISFLMLALLSISSQTTFAHCDSYDGPVIKEAVKALETNNVNLVLIWVNEDQEEEITTLFNKTYELRYGDREIYEIIEKHFFETLVRLHRATEGVGYTGLKPAGSATPIVKMADNSIATASVDDLATKFTAHIEKVVKEKYDKVMELSKVKNESLEKGREYVAAYVDYTHSLEGIHSILEHGSSDHSGHD